MKDRSRDEHNGRAPLEGWVERRERPTDATPEAMSERVFVSGPTRLGASAIVRGIEAAREVVVVATFLFADENIERALLDAAARGVRVYALMAASTRLEREPRDDAEFDHQVREAHKATLRRLGGHVIVRSAEDFHAKFVLIDPRAATARGWLLTANLTREALTRNEELTVELTRDEVTRAFAWARHAFWARATHELADPSQLADCARLPEVTPLSIGGPVLVTCGESRLIRDAMLDAISRAGSRVLVASFGWDRDHTVVQALIRRAKEGVAVTVLARVRPAAMPALLALRAAGATVLGMKWLHAKAIWTDRDEAIVASANLEAHGMEKGFELGVRLDDARASAVARAFDVWCQRATHCLEIVAAVDATAGATENEGAVQDQA